HEIALELPHTPWAQASPTVQALPSSQAAPTGVWTQPTAVAESQLSAVQGFLSSQLVSPPWQTSPSGPPHLSPAVHGLPSLHGWPTFLVYLQLPLVMSHLATTQASSLVQAFLAPGLHTPSL